jgi:hypothetical protein
LSKLQKFKRAKFVQFEKTHKCKLRETKVSVFQERAKIQQVLHKGAKISADGIFINFHKMFPTSLKTYLSQTSIHPTIHTQTRIK